MSWWCLGLVLVLSWWYLGGVSVVFWLCRHCVLVVSWWLLGGFCCVSVVLWWSRVAAAETTAKNGSNKKSETVLLGLYAGLIPRRSLKTY